MRVYFGRGILELVEGDITSQEVDAIVNAANSALAGGGGVDGAIHRRGGPRIMQECRLIGHCSTGQTVLTGAGNLQARFVLHTVGPVWRGGGAGEAGMLASCYRTALSLAREHDCKTVAFPSISTGVYGYPLEAAALVALKEIAEFLETNELPELVRMVLFGDEAYAAYARILEGMVKQGRGEAGK